MPRVPQIDQSVQPAAAPAARVNLRSDPAEFGGDIGRGLVIAGEAAAQVAAEARAEADRLTLAKAVNYFQTNNSALMKNPQNGFLRSQTTDTMERQGEVKDARNKLMQGADEFIPPRLRDRWLVQRMELLRQSDNQINAHVAEQMDAHKRDVRSTFVETKMSQVDDNYMRPGDIGTLNSQFMEEVENWIRDDKDSPEVADSKIKTAQATYWDRAIAAAMRHGRTDLAEEYLGNQDAQDYLSEDAKAKWTSEIADKKLEGKSWTIAVSLMSKLDEVSDPKAMNYGHYEIDRQIQTEKNILKQYENNPAFGRKIISDMKGMWASRRAAVDGRIKRKKLELSIAIRGAGAEGARRFVKEAPIELKEYAQKVYDGNYPDNDGTFNPRKLMSEEDIERQMDMMRVLIDAGRQGLKGVGYKFTVDGVEQEVGAIDSEDELQIRYAHLPEGARKELDAYWKLNYPLDTWVKRALSWYGKDKADGPRILAAIRPQIRLGKELEYDDIRKFVHGAISRGEYIDDRGKVRRGYGYQAAEKGFADTFLPDLGDMGTKIISDMQLQGVTGIPSEIAQRKYLRAVTHGWVPYRSNAASLQHQAMVNAAQIIGKAEAVFDPLIEDERRRRIGMEFLENEAARREDVGGNWRLLEEAAVAREQGQIPKWFDVAKMIAGEKEEFDETVQALVKQYGPKSPQVKRYLKREMDKMLIPLMEQRGN